MPKFLSIFYLKILPEVHSEILGIFMLVSDIYPKVGKHLNSIVTLSPNRYFGD